MVCLIWGAKNLSEFREGVPGTVYVISLCNGDRLDMAEALDSAQEIVTFDQEFAKLPNVQKNPF